MPAIVEFPTVVKEALEEFGPAFANEPERKHFAEYLTGLMIANKKNVSAINREFAITTDQSCLNRWITEVGWDEEAFNNQRLQWLQESSDTRYSQQGVIARDNIPSGKYGTPLEIAKLAVFLCSDDASFIVGQTIVADGGTTSLMSLIETFRNESDASFGKGYV